MAMTVNTNLAANNSQRHLGASNRALSQSLERLSSGLRINRAADDAAGLAIATKMLAQTKGLNQAVRNTNNAIALMQTAEGGVNAITNILQRLRELSVQAASDDNTQPDRENLKSESDSLVGELTRIASTTEYNTMQLTIGSFSGKYFQIGANYQQNITFSINDLRAKSLGKRAAADATLADGVDKSVNTNLASEDVKINSTNIVSAGGDDQVSVLEVVGDEIKLASFASYSSFALTMTASGVDSTSTMGTSVTVGKTVTGSGVTASYWSYMQASVTFHLVGTGQGTLVASLLIDNVGTTISTYAASVSTTLTFTIKNGLSDVACITASVAATVGASAASISGSFLLSSGVAGVSSLTGSEVLQLNATAVTFATMDLTYNASRASYINKIITVINNASVPNVTARAWGSYTSTATVSGIIFSAKKGTDLSLFISTGASLASALALPASFIAGTSAGGTATTATLVLYNGQSSAISKAAAVNLVKGTTNVEAAVKATSVTGTQTLSSVTLSSGDFYINGYDVGAVSGGSDSLVIAINSLTTYTGVTASLENGKLKLSASDGRNVAVFTSKVADEQIGLTDSTLNDRSGNAENIVRGGLTLNSKKSFSITGNNYTDLGTNLEQKTYSANLNNNVGLIDISTQDGAQNAILTIDAALDEVNRIRSEIGAIQNRLEFTVQNLESASENMAASESRIRDADFAYETSRFTRNQILVQAGTAMLAQANTLPQTALQLLR
ncbi:MAG: flagellin [Thermodesulfovibrionales bacterium]